jgi:predicted AAA+ superfamily ATPase
MNIPRVILSQLQKDLGKNKVLVITGARRVGKTFLLKELLATYNVCVYDGLGIGAFVKCEA